MLEAFAKGRQNGRFGRRRRERVSNKIFSGKRLVSVVDGEGFPLLTNYWREMYVSFIYSNPTDLR